MKAKSKVTVVNKQLTTEYGVDVLFLMMDYLEGSEYWWTVGKGTRRFYSNYWNSSLSSTQSQDHLVKNTLIAFKFIYGLFHNLFYSKQENEQLTVIMREGLTILKSLTFLRSG